MRLLPRDDPHEALFDEYALTLKMLATQAQDSAVILRKFELCLLQQLGYAVPLIQNIHDEVVDASKQYYYLPEVGPVSSVHVGQENGVQLSGETLLAMAQDDYSAALTQQQSKQLMRLLINY
ncbi:MAG: DNA repair protein RecO, partial [Methylophilaceae bacterium]